MPGAPHQSSLMLRPHGGWLTVISAGRVIRRYSQRVTGVFAGKGQPRGLRLLQCVSRRWMAHGHG